MTITKLPTSPSRLMASDVYVATFNTWIASLSQLTDEINAAVSSLNSIAAGGAYALPYTWNLGNIAGALCTGGGASQSNGPYLDINNSSSVGGVLALLQQFDASNSTVKGTIRIQKQGDPSRWLIYSINSRSDSGTYQHFIGTVVAASEANPFAAGDPVMLYFQRTGDIGTPGTQLRRVTSVVNQSSYSPNVGNTDTLAISGQAQQLSILAPTGAVYDGQPLIIRVKDNGTAQLVAFASIYRPGTDVPLPSSTTAGKVLYMGFVYNAPDTKWDLTSVLTNI